MIDQYICQYGRRLYGLCLTLCADRAEADDLYQDTWLQVVRNFSRYDAARDFEPWLTRICVNLYRNRWRRMAKSPFLNFRTNEQKELLLASLPAPEQRTTGRCIGPLTACPRSTAWRWSFIISKTWKSRLPRGC